MAIMNFNIVQRRTISLSSVWRYLHEVIVVLSITHFSSLQVISAQHSQSVDDVRVCGSINIATESYEPGTSFSAGFTHGSAQFYSAGIGYSHSFNNSHITFLSELWYMNKGYSAYGTDTSFGRSIYLESTGRIVYTQLNNCIGYSIELHRHITMTGFAGMCIGYNTTNRLTSRKTESGESSERTITEPHDWHKPFELSWIVGVGLSHSLSSSLSILTDLRYNYGLTNIETEPAPPGRPTDIVKNQVLQIVLGIAFRL